MTIQMAKAKNSAAIKANKTKTKKKHEKWYQDTPIQGQCKQPLAIYNNGISIKEFM